MKTQLKALAIECGTILILLFAIPLVIMSFLLALTLQIVWFCVPLASVVIAGILLGIASAITSKKFPPTKKQQTIAEWFAFWPLLGLEHLIMKVGSIIPGAPIVES
jgi:hypothetical protein